MGVLLELAEYGRAIARGWLIVIACVLAGVGAAAYSTSRVTPAYQSSVTFYVVSPPATGQSSLQSLELSRGRIAAYASLVKSDKFIEGLIPGSQTGLSASEIADSISASADQDTLMLTVVVRLPDATQANQTAQAIVGGLSAALGEVEGGRTPTGGGQTELNVVAGPTLETEPVSPRLALNLGLGGLLGLAAGIAIVVSRRLMDKTLRTPEEVEEAAGLPLLARVPVGGGSVGRNVSRVSGRRPASLVEEAARRLRTNINHLPGMPTSGVFVISSARAGEGKSTVALMLARAWAEAGERVLLVEAELRNPRLAGVLELGNGPGLAEVLTGRAALGKAVQHTVNDGLHVVTAGTAPANPTELLAGEAMAAALREMRSTYSRVVIDAPAMQPFSDAALLSVQADWTVMVVRYGRVSRELLQASLRNLALVKGRVAGVVLNALPLRLSEGHKQPSRRPRTPEKPGAGVQPIVPAQQLPVKHAAPGR
jgi:succinoglycan biosynthesis transport protein ExoP